MEDSLASVSEFDGRLIDLTGLDFPDRGHEG
jgi:hypothetical protein